jgi:hypothetical protein
LWRLPLLHTMGTHCRRVSNFVPVAASTRSWTDRPQNDLKGSWRVRQATANQQLRLYFGCTVFFDPSPPPIIRKVSSLLTELCPATSLVAVEGSIGGCSLLRCCTVWETHRAGNTERLQGQPYVGAQLVKRPLQSYTVLTLPFNSDKNLRAAYINFAGQVAYPCIAAVPGLRPNVSPFFVCVARKRLHRSSCP